MKILSAFLSHKSEDKNLVVQVAKQLGWHGIRPWLDAQELPAGVDLPERLRKAVEEQQLLVIFLSRAALVSSWVQDELEVALALEQEGRKESIIPVFLEGHLDLVRSHSRLRKQWMDPDQTRVTRLGIDGTERDATIIARAIAEAAYAHASTQTCADVGVIIDQRGSGAMRGTPALPEALEAQDGPALLFRPDMNERSFYATVELSEWDDFASAMRWALEHALDLSPMRQQQIHWVGQCQMAIAALFGSVVERSSRKTLMLHDANGNCAEVALRQFQEPLRGGRSTAPADGKRTKHAAIVISKPDHPGLPAAKDDARDRNLLLAEVRSPNCIASGDDVLQVARDVTATAVALREQYGMEKLFLYNLSAAPMLAGVVSLLLHVVNDMIILEWVRSAEDYERYPLRKR